MKELEEMFKMLQQVYGDDCISKTRCKDWFTHFKVGRMSTEENPRPGDPSMSISDNKIYDLCTIICKIVV